jgi:hypothetical protein
MDRVRARVRAQRGVTHLLGRLEMLVCPTGVLGPGFALFALGGLRPRRRPFFHGASFVVDFRGGGHSARA